MACIFLPDYALECIRTIEKNGYSAWAVGGCVRDSLLGKHVHDIDLASSAPPEVMKNFFDRVYETGIAHGTVTIGIGDHLIEVTQYRTEGAYTDHRHPDQVFAVDTIEDDLARRDFTVNAMAWHPDRGLVDLFGGKEDLKKQLIRCVGVPGQRFDEDALRILRAFRFASKLNFEIEKNTLETALNQAQTLKNVSVERIQKELIQILGGKRPELISALIEHGGLRHLGLTQSNALIFNLRAVDPSDPAALLAGLAFACDVDTHEFCHRLKTSKKILQRACMMNEDLLLPLATNDYECKKRLLVYGDDYVSFLQYRQAVLREDCSKTLTMVERILASGEPYLISMLAVCGSDLRELGISGRNLGVILQKLLDCTMHDPSLNTKEKLLALTNHKDTVE